MNFEIIQETLDRISAKILVIVFATHLNKWYWRKDSGAVGESASVLALMNSK